MTVGAALLIATYVVLAFAEEKLLSGELHSEYLDYMGRTGPFWPKV